MERVLHKFDPAPRFGHFIPVSYMITDSYSNIEINRIAHENISGCQIVLRHEKEGLAAHVDLLNRTEKNNNYKICWLI
jgi:hypothetical protein